MATIDDVVKHSGVSRSTVFRFLNGSNVRPEAKKLIINAMEQLGYKSNSVVKQQNITIDISISDNFEGFMGFAEVVQGITSRAEEMGIRVQLCRRSGDRIIQDYDRWNGDINEHGVIVVGKMQRDEDIEAKCLINKEIPHIFVNRIMEEPAVSYVSVDLKQAAFDMVDNLIRQGHRKIAVYGNTRLSRVDRDKIEGYRAAFQANDIKVPDDLIFDEEEHGGLEDFTSKLLVKDRKVDAYFAICDSHAMRFVHLAQAKGYRVPEDISVAGMDDIETAGYFKPSITTVHIPFKKMGIMAVDSLLQLISDKDLARIRTIVKHSIVNRESCKNCREL